MSDFNVFWHVLIRDPYLFVGLVSIGVPTIGYWYMYKKLRDLGKSRQSPYPIPALWWEFMAKEYARERVKYAWPAWPMYIMWLGLIIAIPFLLVGISKL
jgi:hypothetical protein